MKLNISNRLRAIWAGVFILVAYGVLASSLTQSPNVVMFADVISGLAVIGIAIMLFPLFKDFDKLWSRIYLVLKYVEGILMVIGGFAFLSSSALRTSIYDNIHIFVFIISAFIFYYLLYVSKLVPRFVSIWGVVGMAALTLSTGLKIFGISYPVLDYFLVLIITNEIFLAGWLMFKGVETQGPLPEMEKN